MKVDRKRPTLFKEQILGLQIDVFKHRCIQAFLITNALCFPASTLVNPTQPKHQTNLNLGLGVLASVAATVVAKMRESAEKEHAAFEKMSKDHFKDKAGKLFEINKAINHVQQQQQLVEYLAALPTDNQKMFFGQQMGLLQALMADQPRQQAVIDVEYSDDSDEKAFTPGRIQQTLDRIASQTSVDMSWLDSKHVFGSKVVVGAKGSGKSTYLRYTTSRFVIECVQAEREFLLYILDGHYDVNDPDKHWLVGLPQEYVAKNFVIKNIDEQFKALVQIKKELTARIDGVSHSPDLFIKVVADEFERYKRNLSPEKFLEVQKISAFIQDEGRKYHVEFDMGLKSLKKENTGIDSATLAQVDWVLFEKACYDSTTKFPSDFDTKEIKQAAIELTQLKPANLKARIVVVLKQDAQSPIVTYLPMLEAPLVKGEFTNTENKQVTRSQDSPFKDILPASVEPTSLHVTNTTSPDNVPTLDEIVAQLKAVCQSYFEQSGKYPTSLQIKTMWESGTGNVIGNDALAFLIEKLGFVPGDYGDDTDDVEE